MITTPVAAFSAAETSRNALLSPATATIDPGWTDRMATFEDLPFEIRIRIFKIARRNAFQTLIQHFNDTELLRPSGNLPELKRIHPREKLCFYKADWLSFAIQHSYVDILEHIDLHTGRGRVRARDLPLDTSTLSPAMIQYLLHRAHWASTAEYDTFRETIRDREAENKRLDALEEKVNALWYSPGMPGAVEAKESFQDLLAGKSSTGWYERVID